VVAKKSGGDVFGCLFVLDGWKEWCGGELVVVVTHSGGGAQ
jgi:hypothetical protein